MKRERFVTVTALGPKRAAPWPLGQLTGVLQIPWLHLTFQRNQIHGHSQWLGRSHKGPGRGLVPIHRILRHLRPVAHAPSAYKPTRQALHPVVW